MVSEESVLQPRSPSFEHSDDWPTFNLTKINITSQRTGQQVSLLSANKSQPVKVSGRLEKIDEEWKHLIRDKRYREKHIELYDITTYAFAEYNDGSYGFWAAGKAGWFELQAPKSSYKLVYTSMDEAASMFYLLADKLKRAAKKRPKMSTKALDTYAFHIFQDVRLNKHFVSSKLSVLRAYSTLLRGKIQYVLLTSTTFVNHSASKGNS